MGETGYWYKRWLEMGFEPDEGKLSRPVLRRLKGQQCP